MKFIETKDFTRKANTLLGDRGLRVLQNELLVNPHKGTIIKGTGGARKLRLALPTNTKGKRSGSRVIYYYQDHKYYQDGIIYLLDVYVKTQQDSLSDARKRELYNIIKAGFHP